LHSVNSVVALTDDQDRVVAQKRLRTSWRRLSGRALNRRTGRGGDRIDLQLVLAGRWVAPQELALTQGGPRRGRPRSRERDDISRQDVLPTIVKCIARRWPRAAAFSSASGGFADAHNVALLGGAGLFFTGSMLVLTLPRFSHTPLPTQQPAIR
jgi:hypothetical protein